MSNLVPVQIPDPLSRALIKLTFTHISMRVLEIALYPTYEEPNALFL